MRIFTRPSFNPAGDTFAAFRHRNYRLWFAGQMVSLTGTWMQNIAQGYLLYTLTSSVAYLGYVGFVTGLPAWLLMIYGGLIADRVPRRTLLLITQSAKMMLALILGALVFLAWVRPWHILLLALLLGVANAFETPARKSLAVDLVKREDLTNAITLNDAMYYTSTIIGPAAGAAVYALIGPSWCFLLNGVSFLAVIAALLMMQFQAPSLPPSGRSVSVDLVEGFRYIHGNRLVQTMTISEFLISIIAYGSLIVLPAWAVKIFNGDVTTNGLLLSAHGIGAVLGGLLIAALASRKNRGKVWTSGSILLPLAMLAFALSRNLPVALFCLGLVGLAYVMLETNNSAIVQSTVPDELRGRVTSLYALMYTGGEPLGALAVGLLAGGAGISLTFIVCTIGMLLFALLIWCYRPEVRVIN